MKQIDAALTALFASGAELTIVDLYTFTLIDGTVFRLTGCDLDVVFGGQTFSSLGPRLQHGSLHWTRGLEVSEMDVKVYPQDTDVVTSANLSYLAAVQQGLFDGALLTLRRTYNPSLKTNLTLDADAPGYGAVILFVGEVAETRAGRSFATIKVKSLMNRLNKMMPSDLYLPICPFQLYGTECGVNKANFLVTGAIGSGSSIIQLTMPSMVIPAGAPGAGGAIPTGWFNAGSILFTSGRNVGITRSIKQFISAGTQNYANTVLQDQPIAYYRLGANAQDSSGSGYHGVATGVTFGQAGGLTGDASQSALFNGSTSYIDLTAVPSPLTLPNYAAAITIECLFKPTAGTVVGLFDSNPGDLTGALRNDSYTLRGKTFQGIEWSPKKPIIPFVVSAGSWHHLALRFRGFRYIDVFVDGALYGSLGVSAAAPVSWAGFVMGKSTRYTGSPQFFGGNIQEWAIYDYGLDDSRIAAHRLAMLAGVSTPATAIAKLLTPALYAPLNGDTFSALPGCDKTLHTCGKKFNNRSRHGAVPFAPPDETSL